MDSPPLTRRALLEESAAKAIALWGAYEALTKVPVASAAAALTHPPEQHLLPGMRVATLPSGTRVIISPPLFQAVTAKLAVAADSASLREAQKELEHALTELDARGATTPGGLGLTVAWSWAYFRRYVPRLAEAHLPLDVALSRRHRRPVFSLLDAVRFPSDPRTTVLEKNDVAFVFRSNTATHISEATERIFHDLGGLFELTSIRHGFVGAGSPRRHAQDAHLLGALKISRSAPLFFGAYPLHPFGEGPGRITNIETLGYASRVDYFRAGTQMHLSHLSEDITTF